ncbi:MAG: translational GTPase TypA [Ruminococcaceae bacterium]|nr:translational GTPase TypA [Oscillospiraceae bacterium]
MIRENLRNVAIIAHVDHGKTTLVDEMLKQGGVFRENQVVADRVMDNNDLERERGITILAKNTSAYYKDVKINIVDTPGHADFGGEVERTLQMVSGVLLLVDAFEGAMPQTRFVLQRALELGLKVIVVVNKIDRPDARPNEVVDEVLELLLDLDATEEQLESPVIFCSGRAGTADFSPDGKSPDLKPLFETILTHIPAPECDPDAPVRVLVSAVDYNDYVGRLGIGKIDRGTLQLGSEVAVCAYGQNTMKKGKLSALYTFDGLKRLPVESASAGDIVCFSGIEGVTIGNTLCAPEAPDPLPFIKIGEPTLEMTFSVNDSPFAGREGKYVTGRHLRDRLYKELLKDVSLRVTDGDTTDSFCVAGRGEMHLSILIENMRREGYEFAVSTPRVLFKEIDGVLCEPYEELTIDVPEEAMGSVMEKMGFRKGEMTQMAPMGSRMRLKFEIPSRGLFGYRSEFMTDTRGEGVLNTLFLDYRPYKGELPSRSTGSLIAFETGEAVSYGLFNAQERGTLFIGAGTPVYEGMVVGQSPKQDDMAVNVCKKKHVTNMRAAGSDEALRLVPPRKMSLEEAIEFIKDDELIEVTPKNFRIRKQILNNELRMKSISKKKQN